MKRLFCVSVLIVIVVAFSSCDDQMKGVMKPVVEEIVEESPAEPEMPADEPTDISDMPAEAPADINYADLPLIESTDFQPGLYRMNVIGSTNTSNKAVAALFMPDPEEKVYVQVFLHPPIPDPNFTVLEQVEVVVRIYLKDGVLENPYGQGSTLHNYHGSIIKFLKHPETGEIDYEYQPTGYEDLPVLKVAFEAGDVQLGQYLMFADSWRTPESKITSAYTEATEEDVRIRVLFDPSPWAITADNMPIFVRYRPDAGVIEITESLGVTTEMTGRKEITYHDFSGILLKSFTQPDISIEYEDDVAE